MVGTGRILGLGGGRYMVTGQENGQRYAFVVSVGDMPSGGQDFAAMIGNMIAPLKAPAPRSKR